MLLCLGACVVCLLANSTGRASLFYDETFSYPNGNLVGNGGWVTHSGTGTPVQVNSGSISLLQGTGSRQDVNRPTGSTMAAGNTWYASFDVSNSGSDLAVYFAHFLQSTSTFGARVWITEHSTEDYTFAFSDGTSITPATTWSDGFSFGDTHKVVVSYSFTGGSTKLWIDPVDESSTSLTLSGTSSRAFTAFAFRQADTSTSVQVIDNLRVGTTFADVVPEPSAFALGGTALFGLFGVVRARRKMA
jgi:hypothetical protein